MLYPQLKLFLLPLGTLVLGGVAGHVFTPGTSHSSMEENKTNCAVSSPSHEWTLRQTNLASSPGSTQRKINALLSPILKGKNPADWNNELQKLFDILGTDKNKSEALRLFFAQWAEVDFDTAIKEAGKLGMWTISVKREMFKQLARKDPKKTAAYYEKNRERLYQYENTVRSIAESWARKSREEAWDWCNSLNNEDKSAAFTGFMKSLDLNNRDLIYEYLNKHLSEKIGIPTEFITHWAQEKPDDALNWFDSHEQNNTTLREALIMGIVDKDLKKAEELLSTMPSMEKSFLVSDIAPKINAKEGPEAALAWIMKQLPASEINSMHLSPITSWTKNTPDDARAWIQKLPTSSMRDEAITCYAINVPGVDHYDHAIELINSMKDATEKKQILERTSKKWERNNPEGLKKWIVQSSLSKDVKSILDSSKES